MHNTYTARHNDTDDDNDNDDDDDDDDDDDNDDDVDDDSEESWYAPKLVFRTKSILTMRKMLSQFLASYHQQTCH